MEIYCLFERKEVLILKVLGITVGDNAGVGPEITVKSLADMGRFEGRYIVYGACDVMKYYADMLKLPVEFAEISDVSEYVEGKINVIDPAGLKMDEYKIGELSAKCGDAAYKYIERAIADALDGKIDAVVTAPLNKEALHMGGHMFDGHTEIFATLTGTKKYAMMFYGPLKAIHVSTHCSLREACDRVKKQRVLDCIELLDGALKMTGVDRPRLAVAGLNPHAGEHGLFGMEEIEEVIPAIEEAQKEGIDVTGPIPPDSIFIKTIQGKYDADVVMYHDQGHIPAKLNWVNEGVNCTIGLPIIRTSVDHGTAFDIAGQGIANEANMIRSMEVAELFLSRKQ